MEKEFQEVIIPFKWTGWNEMDILMNSYYNVTFTDDFGAFKKNDTFSSITVDYQKGLVEGYNDDGSEVTKSQKFKCTPIE
jgi:hypothetical protein